MKKVVIIILLYFLANNLFAQSTNLLWAKQLGGTSDFDNGNAIIVDANGNVYTTGFFMGTADFNPGSGTNTLTAFGQQDVFISKLDASGNFIWAKQLGGVDNEQSYSIAVDASGNVYTTGNFGGTVDFDPGPGITNLTGPGIFISKLDANGNFVFAKKFAGSGSGTAYSIKVDANQNIYTTGGFTDTVDFNPGADIYNLTGSGVFVSKLDASGNFIFAKKFGGAANGYSIAIDANENVYTTGYFQGTTDFDPGPGNYSLITAAGQDIFISKLDASGNFIWAKQFGGGNASYGLSITIDGNGNVYTTGGFEDTVDFDPGPSTYNMSAVGYMGTLDVFVSKLDASGDFLWAKRMGGGINDLSHDVGYSIAVDLAGNVYTTGYFNFTADFDPGPGTYNLTSAGGADIFVCKIDASGNFLWAKQMGGTNQDYSKSINVDGYGNVYITGYFNETSDFDPGAGTYNLTSAGGSDIYVVKLAEQSSLIFPSNFLWAKQIGGANQDAGNSIAYDINGNIFTTGSFTGTADFDPGPGTFLMTTNGNADIFVSKLDPSGNLLWAKQMSGIFPNEGTGIAVDASGNVYTTGYFNGTTDFDPGAGVYNLISDGYNDIFVSKLDSSGNFLWAKRLGGTSDDKGNSIVVAGNGDVYSTGSFQGTADFDPGSGIYNLVANGINSNDIYVSKLDASGNFVWAKQLGGASDDVGTSIAVDANMNVYTTGYFYGVADFDPGAATYNLSSLVSYDIFVSKLNSAGNFVFAKQMGGSNDDKANSITVDINGNIYTTGYFNGTADFDPGPLSYNFTSAGVEDIFISKLDNSGNFLWAKQLGGLNAEQGSSIAVDANGNVYTLGNFLGTTDFDPGPGVYPLNCSNFSDIFISKLDGFGNFLLAKQMGGAADDRGKSITVDANGYLYITGYFNGTADFDPSAQIYNLTSFGLRDAFVVKFKADPLVFTKPKIYTSKAILNVGQSQTITGKDFSIGGLVNLVIKNSSEDLIPVTSITYLPDGGFTYQLPITSTMLNGEFTVYATDNNSGQISATSRFRVNNSAEQKLTVTAPTTVGDYRINKLIQIRWVDFVTNCNATSISGFVQKRYKIERSINGGSSWQIIASNKVFSQVQSNQTKEFNAVYAFSQSGTYLVKVTDLDNATNNNISASFNIVAAGSGGFTSILEWDKSILPLPANIANPDGLAADGTSRIIIKLKKDASNPKSVKNIHATIEDISGNATSADLLGKIKPAKITTVYSAEANNANLTTCDTVFTIPSIDQNFYFWLVSPDDFTQNPNSGASERVIKVDFIITYSDNSTTNITAYNIRIVRPPLLLVHGLNGDSESFANAKFDIGNGPTNFKNAINRQTIWRYGKVPTLINYGSFDQNATELLGSMDNSFKSILIQMRAQGYACNKVDYVCHSMGGSIARTIINKYPSIYFSHQNYNKGFINKLITINTPHNGSYIADFFIDNVTSIRKNALTEALIIANQLTGFFDPFDNNKPSLAVYNLQAYNGGITFKETVGVKNHLIGSDIDAGNNTHISLIDLDTKTAAVQKMLYSADVPWKYFHNIPKFILEKYSNNEYFSNTDVVVPISSQLPGKVDAVINTIDPNFISGHLPNSKIYSDVYQYPIIHTINATKVTHTAITDNLTVGSRVMFLLNSAINSTSFENTIPANNNTGGAEVYSAVTIADATDSVFSYIDTAHLKIASPGNNTNVYVDSTLNVNVLISDTAGFKNVQLIFQGETYESSSKITNQTFNFNVHSDAIGKNTLVAKGLYDSLGYTIYHSDTVLLKVISKDTLKGLYVTPKSQNLNRNHFFHPTYNAIYTTYIGTLNNDIDSLTFTIADTNVVKYIDSLKYFITKDTGTTHIIFNYKGFIDSAFIYVGTPLNENITTTCSSTTFSFYAGSNDTSKTYQWQVDSTNGFENIIPGIHYSGVDSCTLTLINAPSNWYNYRYRCLISDSIGSTSSQVFTLRFSVAWTGAVDTTWQNPANWSCGNLPDSNIDVIIPTGKPRYPQVNTNVACRSLDVQHGAAVLVKTGFRIDITGKNQ